MRTRTTSVLLVITCALLSSTAIADVFSGLTGGGQPHTNTQPSLAINHIIALNGTFPNRNGANSTTTLGEVSIFAGNFAPSGWALCEGQILPINLHQALYSILGTTYGGDGRTSFALPDLRDRTAIGEGHGAGLADRRLGQTVGASSVTLTPNQLPAHTHSLPGSALTDPSGGNQYHNNIQPSLALNYNIAVTGIYPSRSGGYGENSDSFIGEVRRFAGNFTLGGRGSTDGQLLPIAQNTALFSIVGTTYGGDGRTTFALPDLQGRAVMHAGRGSGLTDRRIGQELGAEQVNLTEANLPSHNHTIPNLTEDTGLTGGGQAHNNIQPSSVLNYIIALGGTYPSRNSGGLSDNFLGEVSLFAGNFAPDGWALCDGQLLSIANHQALFSLVGTMYGGDGRTTFALPDLRGRIAVHPDSNRIGAKFGAEYATLSASQMPSHNHQTPEPATMGLLSMGALAVLRKRRK